MMIVLKCNARESVLTPTFFVRTLFSAPQGCAHVRASRAHVAWCLVVHVRDFEFRGISTSAFAMSWSIEHGNLLNYDWRKFPFSATYNQLISAAVCWILDLGRGHCP